MECVNDLAEGKKLLVIEEIGKAKTNKSIAERKNRCVTTEIGKSVRIFGNGHGVLYTRVLYTRGLYTGHILS